LVIGYAAHARSYPVLFRLAAKTADIYGNIGNTMRFTSETPSNGVIERHFILDEITGLLWSPTSGTIGSPLLLAGHTGGMHKMAPGLVASALHSVTSYGFTVAAIDAPGHG
jgi:hypothetical protein